MNEEFKKWMKEVDNEVLSLSGCSVHDMGDYCFMDAFLDGRPAWEVADEILTDEGFPFEG